MNTPNAWTEYIHLVPALKNAVVWKSLRQWSLSEVWRVTMPGGNTMIAKKGMGENSREASVYEHLLRPLKVDSPIIYNAISEGSVGILLMEDVKGKSVEEHPEELYFIEAARKLAAMRSEVRSRLANKGSTIKDVFYLKKDKLINDLFYIKKQHHVLEINQDVILQHALDILPKQLEELYKRFPVTITHNDFYPKNMVRVNKQVTIIDWANANLSPHLGDLYCLISSAEDYGVSAKKLTDAYRNEVEEELSVDLEWQITMGGICWTIYMVRWLIDHGAEAIPESKEWIPGMVTELDRLLHSL
ncbi:phosphotransferase [Guptibacillus algicola]|uniref:phosphotransferase n=1 Tax=Guptibacillus algicola TaxID=225844 RepID=UPI001CD4FDF5|nr:phosphotransferase [Alkalihalobacillus algicola]MCA0988502.1 aminoglycoside phosphotransferase family protein [Alkalihalobacillus algicola]